MRDDFHSQAWADSHQHLSTAIHKLVRPVSEAMTKLNAYQFDAPWLARPARRKDSASRPA